jgi:hypothetical protein
MIKANRDFTKTDYFTAALTREKDFQHLRKEKECIVFSLYCAGVSIECMLRAYIKSYTDEFDEKHDLKKLFIKSLISEKLTDKEKEKITVNIEEANRIWNNNLRYCSTIRMKRILIHEIAGKNKQQQPKDFEKYLLNYKGKLFEIAKDFLTITKKLWT